MLRKDVLYMLNLPFSIDALSLKSESQKAKLVSTQLTDESSINIFMIEGLVKQEPITIF